MNRVFISIGSINIYWYSIFIIIAIILGYILTIKEAKRQNISQKIIENLLFYMIIVAIIGARIYYVIFNLKEFNSLTDILAIYNGGLAIYGGIIASIIFIYFYSKKHKINFLQILNLLAPALILGQAIGRWGNFFNQEAYGSIVTYEYLNNLHIPKFIINSMYIDGSYHHPTFLYESILCFLGFIILIILRKKKSKNITFVYLIYYGIIRFFIEGLRTDSLYLFNFRISQIVSILFILIGISGIIYNNFRRQKKWIEK